MNCPMVQPKISFEGGEEMVAFAKCTQEECAWWEKEASCCAILLIPKHLYTLERMLGMMLEKMPHEEQFRK